MEKKNKHNPSKYLTIADSATYLSVSQATIRNWIKNGWLRAAIVGAIVRVKTAELELFLHRNSRITTNAAPKTTRGRYQRKNSEATSA